jgi:hypothetical protein
LIEFPPFNKQADCRYGRMLFNTNDIYIGRSLELYGEFSEAEVDLFRQIVKPGSFVVMYWHLPPLFNPNNFFQNATNVFGNTVSANMLCVHKSIPQKLEGLPTVQLDVPSLF